MSEIKKKDSEKILSSEFLDEVKRVREEKNISIDEIAEATNIKAEYIKAIEQGDLSRLPGGVYNKAYIRTICDYLGINTKEYERTVEPNEVIDEEQVKVSFGPDKDSMMPSKTTIIITLIAIVVVYIIFFSKEAETPQQIVKDSPIENISKEVIEEELIISIIALEDTQIKIYDKKPDEVDAEDAKLSKEETASSEPVIDKNLDKYQTYVFEAKPDYTMFVDEIKDVEVYLNGIYVDGIKGAEEEGWYSLNVADLIEGVEDESNVKSDKTEENAQGKSG